MLFVGLYKCLTWSFTFRTEAGFRVFENRVLRKLLGPKGQDITEDCFILHEAELHGL
jgi:hypothetical protein